MVGNIATVIVNNNALHAMVSYLGKVPTSLRVNFDVTKRTVTLKIPIQIIKDFNTFLNFVETRPGDIAVPDPIGNHPMP